MRGVAATNHGVATAATAGRHAQPAGDFSTYTLHLARGTDPARRTARPAISAVEFLFKVDCPSEFDRQPCHVCPPGAHGPEMDYLTKTTPASASSCSTAWPSSARLARAQSGRPAGVARRAARLRRRPAELFPGRGRHRGLSRHGRRRISLRRHARLLDYLMHDGCNARAWLCLTVSQDAERNNPSTEPR